MKTTKKGYSIYRAGTNFVVQETRIKFDEASEDVFAELDYHSQLIIFVGMGHDACKNMIRSWLSYFDDEDLIAMALEEVDSLFEKTKLLPIAVTCEDDKDMN